MSQINLGDIAADVVLKKIKNIHISVYPPAGRVRISAPQRMGLDALRLFALSKLDWIKRQQTRLREQEHATPCEYVDRESHFVWGTRYLLTVCESDDSPSLAVEHGQMVLRIHPEMDLPRRHVFVETLYRDQMKQAVPPLLAKWQPQMGVEVKRFFVRRMKTRW